MKYALVDIGNTAIKAKIFKDDNELSVCTVGSDHESLDIFFNSLRIDVYIISSVVPRLNKVIESISRSSLFFLTHDHFLDLKIAVDPRESVGIDRLVNAVAVQHIWNANALIIDVGTAVTFCRVKKNGHYLGGIIAPGVHMIRHALFEGAEQLPLVDFPWEEPSVIGQSTTEAMSSGLFYGAIEMINGIQEKIKKEDSKMATILTGGIPSILIPHLNHDVYQRDLQFEGLKIIAKKLKKIN